MTPRAHTFELVPGTHLVRELTSAGQLVKEYRFATDLAARLFLLWQGLTQQGWSVAPPASSDDLRITGMHLAHGVAGDYLVDVYAQATQRPRYSITLKGNDLPLDPGAIKPLTDALTLLASIFGPASSSPATALRIAAPAAPMSMDLDQVLNHAVGGLAPHKWVVVQLPPGTFWEASRRLKAAGWPSTGTRDNGRTITIYHPQGYTGDADAWSDPETP